jgi:hypothetical protein
MPEMLSCAKPCRSHVARRIQWTNDAVRGQNQSSFTRADRPATKWETQSKILSRTAVYANAGLRAVVKSSRAWSRLSVLTLPEGRAPSPATPTLDGRSPVRQSRGCSTQREVITAINRCWRYAGHRSLFRCNINADFRAALSGLLCWGVVGSNRYANAFLWGVRP